MKSTLAIKQEATNTLTGRWGKAILIFLFIFLISITVSLYPLYFPIVEKPWSILIEFAISFLILQPFQMGSIVFLMKLVKREPVSTGLIFDGYKYLKKLLPFTLLYSGINAILQEYVDVVMPFIESGEKNIMAILPYFLTILILNLILSQVRFLIYDHPDWSGLLCIGRGVVLIIKNLMSYITLQLSFLLWLIAAAFSGGFLLIWLLPYMETANTIFYHEIKDKA